MAIRPVKPLPDLDKLTPKKMFGDIYQVINPLFKTHDSREIALDKIQPTESLLIKDWVYDYLKNPDLLFSPSEPIIIMRSSDIRFNYFTRSGDHQLYALCMAGVETVTVAPFYRSLVELITYPNNQLNLARETYREGVKDFEDFRNRLVNEEEYERIMTMRYYKNH